LSTPPIFFFIDPFGYAGFPMHTLKRILQYPKVELFINFMVSEVNRWLSESQFDRCIYDLFGTDEFKAVRNINDPEDKIIYLRNLYCKQLREFANARFIMPFRINTPGQIGRAKYYLVHASKNLKAFRLMKDTMARASLQQYSFEAIGMNDLQVNLFEDPEKVEFRGRLLQFIKNNSNPNCHYTILENWAYINTCGWYKTIKETLIELEAENRILIKRQPRQRKNTVTDGALISYID
jgi:hypothetical protein